ncbi:MAG TPA: family 1 glycosylhydrolase [Armatimonadota bacterium]|nr:family 1 glycosylhydrolase [Armatimonadota bacterium]
MSILLCDFAAATGGKFVFATGIECSYPTITTRNGQRKRLDELEKCFHYRFWREDLALTREIGLSYLRYGPPYYRIHTGADSYDWAFTDEVFAEMRRLKLTPIVDLCHFGVPDWVGNFQNPDWPVLFAGYARRFARRYPWVQFYTPVNEIYVCAKLSALRGFWNEQLHSELGFLTALKHLCKANLLAIRSILEERSDAIFIQSESAEYYHEGSPSPDVREVVSFENRRRFLSFDFIYSRPVDEPVRKYLRENGMTDAEYDWFMRHGLSERIVMGNDFYERNEQMVRRGGEIEPAGVIYGWYLLTREYYARYQRPVMHTETNNIGAGAEDAPRWLWIQFLNVRLMRSEGAPVLGFTWFSLTDQMDWDVALSDERSLVNPVGLYDLQRRPRPVAAAYREIVREYQDQLPIGP